MRFSFASALVAVAALAHTAWAASAAIPTTSVAPVDGPANPITQPIGDKTLKAGEAFTITWTPTTGTTVSLILRKGADKDHLATLSTIASNVPNTGSFSWTPSTQLAGASDYAIQITGDRDTSNYSPAFSIDSSGPGVSALSTSTTLVTVTSSTSASSSSTSSSSASPSSTSSSSAPSSSSASSASASSSASSTPASASASASSSAPSKQPSASASASASASGSPTSSANSTISASGLASSAPSSTQAASSNGAVTLRASALLCLGVAAAAAYLL